MIKYNETECKPEDELPKRELRRILQKHKMFGNQETGEPILTHIEMNPDAKPVIQPPRPVPPHLEEKTKKLDYFVQEGLMTWTKPGEPIMYARGCSHNCRLPHGKQRNIENRNRNWFANR